MWAHDPWSAQDMSTSNNLCSPGPSLGISWYLSARALPLLAGICQTTTLPFILISLKTEFWIEDINLLSHKSEWKSLLQKSLLHRINYRKTVAAPPKEWHKDHSMSQGCQPGCEKNGERMRKWRGNGERMMKWRGNGERFTLYISSFSFYFLPLYPFPITKMVSLCRKTGLHKLWYPGIRDTSTWS